MFIKTEFKVIATPIKIIAKSGYLTKIIQSSFLIKSLGRRNHLLLLNKRINIPDKIKKANASK